MYLYLFFLINKYIFVHTVFVDIWLYNKMFYLFIYKCCSLVFKQNFLNFDYLVNKLLCFMLYFCLTNITALETDLHILFAAWYQLAFLLFIHAVPIGECFLAFLYLTFPHFLLDVYKRQALGRWCELWCVPYPWDPELESSSTWPGQLAEAVKGGLGSLMGCCTAEEVLTKI